MTMIEKVEIAIRNAEIERPGSDKTTLRNMAIAAIEAMREPDEAMRAAAAAHKNEYYLTEGNDYNVMINAALEEK